MLEVFARISQHRETPRKGQFRNDGACLKEQPALDRRNRLHRAAHHGVERRLDLLELVHLECPKDQSEIAGGPLHGFDEDAGSRLGILPLDCAPAMRGSATKAPPMKGKTSRRLTSSMGLPPRVARRCRPPIL